MVEQGQAVIAFRSPSRRSGYAELPTVVILDATLSDASVRLYALLVSYAIQSDGCIVTQKSIAEDLKRSTRAVQRGLAELTERHLVNVQRQGLTQPNIYWIENAYEAYDSKSPDKKNPGRKKNDKSVAPDATDLSHQETPKVTPQEATGMAYSLRKNLKKESQTKSTLNVGGAVNFVDEGKARHEPVSNPSLFPASSDPLDQQVSALVEELQDWGSERRHRQLLSLCEQHSLADLPTQALHATRQRQSREGKRGPVGKPGAYYARVLLKMLEDRQVFVPTSGEDDPEEVRRLIRQSLNL